MDTDTTSYIYHELNLINNTVENVDTPVIIDPSGNPDINLGRLNNIADIEANMEVLLTVDPIRWSVAGSLSSIIASCITIFVYVLSTNAGTTWSQVSIAWLIGSLVTSVITTIILLHICLQLANIHQTLHQSVGIDTNTVNIHTKMTVVIPIRYFTSGFLVTLSLIILAALIYNDFV